MRIIFQRRSVRRFTDQPVEAEKIEQILRAAMAAPSAGNQQPWEFFVVRNREKLEALSKVSPHTAPAARAQVAIVAVYRRNCRYPQTAPLDLAASSENLLLAAAALNLGCVWLSLTPWQDRMEQVAAILALPAELVPFAVFPLGYPESAPKSEDRFKPERVHLVV